MDTDSFCPSCRALVQAGNHFCPNCGKQLKEKPLSKSVFAQIGIYAFSLFLPPLGLWPGIKYFKSSDPTAKKIGIAAIIITAISTVATLWYATVLYQQLTQSIGTIGL